MCVRPHCVTQVYRLDSSRCVYGPSQWLTANVILTVQDTVITLLRLNHKPVLKDDVLGWLGLRLLLLAL